MMTGRQHRSSRDELTPEHKERRENLIWAFVLRFVCLSILVCCVFISGYYCIYVSAVYFRTLYGCINIMQCDVTRAGQAMPFCYVTT